MLSCILLPLPTGEEVTVPRQSGSDEGKVCRQENRTVHQVGGDV